METQTYTRRQVLGSVLAGAAGFALGGSARDLFAAQSAVASGPPDIQRLTDDLFVVRIPGESNVVAQSTGGGVLLVDGCSARGSGALMQAVAALPNGGPVHTLFNTHWHPEQTGSNELVGKAGKTIIAQENTRLWLNADVTWPWNGRQVKRLPMVALPNKSFYDTGQLESPKEGRQGLPEDRVRYGYIPDCAHTDGDLYVHFPKQNVLAVGDVVSNDGWPVVDWATGGWIGGMVGGLQRVLSLVNDETRIVPGRGPVMNLNDLKMQFDMYQAIYERLSKLLNSGRGPTEAVEARPTKEFDAKMGNPDEFVRRAFESLWAYVTPDA